MSDKKSEFQYEAANLANSELGNALNDKGKRLLGTKDGENPLNTYEKSVKSRIDRVTGLLSRWVWEDEMDALYKVSARNRMPFSIAMMDVDGLKEINDKDGHHTGDLILNNFGKAILNGFRKSDICGRYGGDEAIVMLIGSNIKPESISDEEGKLAAELSRSANVGISVGIEKWDGVSTLEDTIRNADARLYLNKNKKKNGK